MRLWFIQLLPEELTPLPTPSSRPKSISVTDLYISELIEERIENKILPVWPDKLQPAGNAMMWNSHSILFILFMYVLENTLFNKLAWKVRWIPSAAPAKCILLKGGWKKKSMDLKW